MSELYNEIYNFIRKTSEKKLVSGLFYLNLGDDYKISIYGRYMFEDNDIFYNKIFTSEMLYKKIKDSIGENTPKNFESLFNGEANLYGRMNQSMVYSVNYKMSINNNSLINSLKEDILSSKDDIKELRSIKIEPLATGYNWNVKYKDKSGKKLHTHNIESDLDKYPSKIREIYSEQLDIYDYNMEFRKIYLNDKSYIKFLVYVRID
jgi:hypothetical protein